MSVLSVHCHLAQGGAFEVPVSPRRLPVAAGRAESGVLVCVCANPAAG